MGIKFLVKHLFIYLKDQSVDIRIRMLYFLEYASLLVCLIGTIFMILLHQPIASMIPNFILFVMSFLGLYLSHVRKKYDLSALIIIIGCANIALPWMFFSAGGSDSGMPVWFLFSIIVTCMMSNGKIRVLMAALTTAEDLACICVGHYFPETVTPLTGNDAAFIDYLQSFGLVCICLTTMLTIYIITYENQRKQLEAQSIELRTIMQTDALTGTFNRHAYYNEISALKNGGITDDLVIVAMDVNGLKRINDESGHSAGDDYIRAAARAVSRAMGQYGHIFRTGGDEFMAILHCSAEEAQNLERRLKESSSFPDNPWFNVMAIAIGIVCAKENPDLDLSELEKLADKKMYENKSAYYRQHGIDRRK